MEKMVKISVLIFIFLAGCSGETEIDQKFTIAVIPDTQNYLDYRHQPEEGFSVNAGAMFLEQMKFIADNAASNGGEIEFATSVGDVWDHVDLGIDPDHAERGLQKLGRYDGRDTSRMIAGRDQVEIPLAREGYGLLDEAKLPFSVVPGNHDFDWLWYDSRFPLNMDRIDEIRDDTGWIHYMDPEILGMLHYGGLRTFAKVFGPQSEYFKDRPWYVAHFNNGANSAQIFEAGGYTFLHFGFEMQAGQAVLDWAKTVMDAYPGLPTIITTHDYLDPNSERIGDVHMDFARVDPDHHKQANDIWQDFISKHDQIFIVLSGHYRGSAMRTDQNEAGNNVYQLLSNYQGRGQVEKPGPGERPGGIGDGWLRLMEFDMGLDVPVIKVRTYSTYYKKYSSEMPDYARWYKRWEHADITDQEFYALDDFTIELTGFRGRFDEN